ncbi:hypothetical protein BC829DRAFT_487292 [Chytridium lagenaria]|nr:hypothetical protein BC829DRAFT_487292 [Chytridium lagenaria]
MLTKKRQQITDVERLEVENKKMEERLQALRDYLAIQKEKRGESESVWKAGKMRRGSLTNYAGDVLAKRHTKKNTYKGVATEVQNLVDAAAKLSAAARPAEGGTYIKLSMPGGTDVPMMQPKPPTEPPRDPTSSPPKRMWRVPTAAVDRPLSTLPESDEQEEVKDEGKPSTGAFDEEESRRQFLEALAAWRQKPMTAETEPGRRSEGMTPDRERDTQASTSTLMSFPLRNSSPDAIRAAALELISFDPLSGEVGLSYFERLLLKTYRTMPEVDAKSITPPIKDDDTESDVDELDIRPVFAPEETEKVEIKRRCEVVEIEIEEGDEEGERVPYLVEEPL